MDTNKQTFHGTEDSPFLQALCALPEGEALRLSHRGDSGKVEVHRVDETHLPRIRTSMGSAPHPDRLVLLRIGVQLLQNQHPPPRGQQWLLSRGFGFVPSHLSGYSLRGSNTHRTVLGEESTFLSETIRTSFGLVNVNTDSPLDPKKNFPSLIPPAPCSWPGPRRNIWRKLLSTPGCAGRAKNSEQASRSGRMKSSLRSLKLMSRRRAVEPSGRWCTTPVGPAEESREVGVSRRWS